MIKIQLLILFLSLSTCFAFGQSKSKFLRDKYLFVSTSASYYPPLASYSFFQSFRTSNERILLDYKTSSSGTFEIDGDQVSSLDRETNYSFPSQLISVGGGIQIRNQKSLYHDLSLTRLSHIKSSKQRIDIQTRPLLGVISPPGGFDERHTVFSFRYETGKFFGKERGGNTVRFGLGGAIEPSFYSLNRIAYSQDRYSIKGSLFAVEIAIVPTLAMKLSDQIFLDLKVIPNILIADYSTFEIEDPSLTSKLRAGTRSYNPPEINLVSSIQLRYMLKEPKRKRRSSSNS